MLLAHHEDVDDFAPLAEGVPEIGLDDGAMERPHVNHGRRIEAMFLGPTVPLVGQRFVRSLHLLTMNEDENREEHFKVGLNGCHDQAWA